MGIKIQLTFGCLSIKWARYHGTTALPPRKRTEQMGPRKTVRYKAPQGSFTHYPIFSKSTPGLTLPVPSPDPPHPPPPARAHTRPRPLPCARLFGGKPTPGVPAEVAPRSCAGGGGWGRGRRAARGIARAPGRERATRGEAPATGGGARGRPRAGAERGGGGAGLQLRPPGTPTPTPPGAQSPEQVAAAGGRGPRGWGWASEALRVPDSSSFLSNFLIILDDFPAPRPTATVPGAAAGKRKRLQEGRPRALAPVGPRSRHSERRPALPAGRGRSHPQGTWPRPLLLPQPRGGGARQWAPGAASPPLQSLVAERGEPWPTLQATRQLRPAVSRKFVYLVARPRWRHL